MDRIQSEKPGVKPWFRFWLAAFMWRVVRPGICEVWGHDYGYWERYREDGRSMELRSCNRCLVIQERDMIA